MFNVIYSGAASILGEKMIIRYVNMCDNIRRGVWSDQTLNREYSYQLDLIITYMLMRFYQGATQPEIKN